MSNLLDKLSLWLFGDLPAAMKKEDDKWAEHMRRFAERERMEEARKNEALAKAIADEFERRELTRRNT